MKLTQIKNELEQLKKDATEAEARYTDLLKAAEASLEKAEADSLAAFKVMDVDAYHKAQDAARSAADTAKMYKTKLAGAATEALISTEEYKAKMAEIRAELDAAVSVSKKSIIDDIQHIIDTAEEIGTIVNDGNKLMWFLQHDIFRDDPVHLREEYKGGYPLLWLAQDLREKDIYKERVYEE